MRGTDYHSEKLFSYVRPDSRILLGALGAPAGEQMNYNLLFRRFVGLCVDEPVWVPTVFSHNRDRLLAGDIAANPQAACDLPAGGRITLGADKA